MHGSTKDALRFHQHTHDPDGDTVYTPRQNKNNHIGLSSSKGYFQYAAGIGASKSLVPAREWTMAKPDKSYTGREHGSAEQSSDHQVHKIRRMKSDTPDYTRRYGANLAGTSLPGASNTGVIGGSPKSTPRRQRSTALCDPDSSRFLPGGTASLTAPHKPLTPSKFAQMYCDFYTAPDADGPGTHRRQRSPSHNRDGTAPHVHPLHHPQSPQQSPRQSPRAIPGGVEIWPGASAASPGMTRSPRHLQTNQAAPQATVASHLAPRHLASHSPRGVNFGGSDSDASQVSHLAPRHLASHSPRGVNFGGSDSGAPQVSHPAPMHLASHTHGVNFGGSDSESTTSFCLNPRDHAYPSDYHEYHGHRNGYPTRLNGGLSAGSPLRPKVTNGSSNMHPKTNFELLGGGPGAPARSNRYPTKDRAGMR